MDRKTYQWCVVPMCTNTSIRTPEKLFIAVPGKGDIRKKWLQLARRNDALQISTNSPIFCCEDHFDLPNDMENYMQYRLMGSVKKIRMRPGCMPSKFDCQPDRKRCLATSINTPRLAAIKRQRKDLIQEAENSIELLISEKENSRSEIIDKTAQPCSSSPLDLQCIEKTKEKAVQAYVQKSHYRSKSTQTTVNLRNIGTSPIKTSAISVALSPFIIKTVPTIRPSTSGMTKVTKQLFVEEKSDSDISIYTPSQGSSQLSSSPPVSMSCETSESNSLHYEYAKLEKEHSSNIALQNTISKIEKKPRFYIGLPKECYFLLHLLSQNTNITVQNILLCLKKIRLDTKFVELADDFGISGSFASKVFLKNIPIISASLKSFIVKSDKQFIKKNLPLAFRHRYNKVSCIIDCFEIEIQKPSKSLHQALTWSEYKKANTIKYLISSTPDGLVNYISPGYGGRISDILLVQESKFLDELTPGSHVLADRGFKNIESLLSEKGCHLLRPPSVISGSKLTQQEAQKTKQIASLRIHIERVIRRLREFSMLKPHSVVNTNLIRVLDECVITACGLINIQDGIVK